MPDTRDVVVAAALAGVLSGVPSTAHALATGRPLLDAARAAGALLGRPSLLRGLVAHALVSVAWAAVLARVLPSHRRVEWGAVGGLGIAALDLTLAQHRFPEIAKLPRFAQVADHVAFGALVGLSLDATSGRTARGSFGPLSDVTLRRTMRFGRGVQAPYPS